MLGELRGGGQLGSARAVAARAGVGINAVGLAPFTRAHAAGTVLAAIVGHAVQGVCTRPGEECRFHKSNLLD